jgi:AraC-like DNA-binding protein
MKQVKKIIKISKIPKSCRERYLNLSHASAHSLQQNSIMHSGVSNLRQGYQVGHPRISKRYMVIITIRGEGGLLSSNGERYMLDGGSIIVHPPGLSYTFYAEDDCWDIIWFYIEKDSRYMDGFADKVSYWHDLYQFPEMSAAMEGYLHEHERMHSNNSLYTESAAKNYAELITITLKRILERNTVKRKDNLRETVDSIWVAVRQNISREWQVPELARQAGMSQSTFQRYMRKVFNCSPKQMLLNIRMEEAKHLLLSSSYPLRTIAERLNYSNEFAFSYAFKRRFKISPREFRKK